MSFIRRIGDQSGSHQQLLMMRKKYFRNILQFNQVSQQQKKQQQVKARQQSNKKFNKLIDQELQALQIQKEKLWHQKINHQHILKDDYQKQIVEKGYKVKKQKQVDKQFMKMQHQENDRFMERRMLDFMKIYDRKAIRNSQKLNRRVRTQSDQHYNPEVQSYPQLSHQKINQLEKGQYSTSQLKSKHLQHRQHSIPDRNIQADKSNRINNGQLSRMKRQFQERRKNASQLPSIQSQKSMNNRVSSRPGSKGKQGIRSSKFLPQNNNIF